MEKRKLSSFWLQLPLCVLTSVVVENGSKKFALNVHVYGFMVILCHHSKRALWQFFVSIFHRIIMYIVFWCSSEYGYIFYLDLGSLITLSHLMMDSCHTQPSGRSLRNRHRGPLHTWLYYSLVQKTNVVPFPPTENNAPRAQPLLCDFCADEYLALPLSFLLLLQSI